MKIRVFLRSQNPAIDPPAYHLKERDCLDRDFFSAQPGELFACGRARKIDERSMQLIQRGAGDPAHVSFGNYSGGDPGTWAIVGQTDPEIGPGFPHYALIAPGRAGLNP